MIQYDLTELLLNMSLRASVCW